MVPAEVCVITSVHSAFDVRIFYKECKSLAEAGYNITLIAQHDRDEIVNGIKIVSLPSPRNRFERMTRTSWLAYRNAVKIKADIYHFHDPELLPVGLVLRLHGKKVIYDMHENVSKDIKDKYWINPRYRNFISRLFFWVERIFLFDLFVIFAENSYRADYSWIKKHSTVLNMPLIDQMPSPRINMPSSGEVSVGYIGGVAVERGSLIMIEAIKKLNDRGYKIKFEVVGPIDKPHKVQLLKLCEEYHLHDVKFHGYMSPHEAWPIIAQCHMGLAVLQPIPNFIESYPTKIFEYMAMAMPIIASNFTLYRNVVETNRCGICIDPRNADELADAMQFIIDNPTEAERMGRNGRKAIETLYNWNNEKKKLLESYDQLLT